MQSLFVGALLLSAPLAALSQTAATPVATPVVTAAPNGNNNNNVATPVAVAVTASPNTATAAAPAAGTVATDAASPAVAPATMAAVATPVPTSSCINITTALSQPGFSSFVAAANYTELLETVPMLDNSTFFIPSDTAFAAAFKALNVTNITQIPMHVLQNIILAHVIDGRVLAATDIPANGLKTLPSALTDMGHVHNCPANITVMSTNGQVEVMSGNTTAHVLHTIPVCQGIVHEIDSVLVPCNLTLLNEDLFAPAPAPHAHAPAHAPGPATVTVSTPSSGPATIIVNGPAAAPGSSGPVAQAPRSAAGALSAGGVLALFAAAIASLALL